MDRKLHDPDKAGNLILKCDEGQHPCRTAGIFLFQDNLKFDCRLNRFILDRCATKMNQFPVNSFKEDEIKIIKTILQQPASNHHIRLSGNVTLYYLDLKYLKSNFYKYSSIVYMSAAFSNVKYA